MSYRELRDATEVLRTLEYPRLVSIENFRIPNFELMSEILEWTVKKFDANTRIPKNKETENDRILFVKTCVLALMQKARIKLNPRNLYMSDGHAIRELSPVLKLLYQTTKTEEDKENDSSQLIALRNHINSKKQDIRIATTIANEIPINGATIYDLLSKELFAKEARMKALSQQLNVGEVEKIVRQMIDKATKEKAEIEDKLNNIGQSEQNLDQKIERRKLECEQLQKRVVKLQAYRPPNRDEFERLEEQLKGLYQEYVIKYRNLCYMKQQMNDVEVIEHEKSVDAEKNMRLAVEKMRQENAALPPVELKIEDDETQTRPRIYGNMIGAGLSDEDDDDEDDDDLDDDGNLDIQSDIGAEDFESKLGNNIVEDRQSRHSDNIENFNPEVDAVFDNEDHPDSENDF